MPVRCLALCCLWLAATGAVRAQETVVLVPGRTEYPLGPWLLEDPTGAWTLEEVVHDGAFRPAAAQVPSLGYTDAAYWLRFTLQDAAENAVWVLEVANKSLDHLTLYTPTDSGYTARTVGDALPFGVRAVRHRNFVFPLALPAGTPQTLYLRVASHGPMNLPLRVWEAEAFLHKDQQEQFFLGAFFGILAIMVVYNLILFTVFRDPSYLYYVLYIASYIVYQLSVERIAFQFLWPDATWWMGRANNVLGLVTAVWALQFTRSYLHTANYVPRLDRVIRGLIAGCVGLMLPAFLGVPGMNSVMAFYFIGLVGVALTAGTRCLMKGHLAARYYLLAWSFLLGGIFVGMVRNLGMIPYSAFAARSVQVGAVLEVMLLSFGLGYRYDQLRRERERLRLRIASDLHDDIGSGLTQISLYSELVRRGTDGPARTWADQIGTMSRSLSGRMQDIVWAIKPEEETWDALELRMRDFAKELLEAGALTMEMQGSVDEHPPDLPPDVRQNVLLMFKEILHNTVKHADATHVRVRWQLSRHHLRLLVADDGRGFDPATAAPGNGLGSLRRRAREIGATLLVDTAPGRGTKVELDVPLGRPPT